MSEPVSLDPAKVAMTHPKELSADQLAIVTRQIHTACAAAEPNTAQLTGPLFALTRLEDHIAFLTERCEREETEIYGTARAAAIEETKEACALAIEASAENLLERATDRGASDEAYAKIELIAEHLREHANLCRALVPAGGRETIPGASSGKDAG